MTSQSDPETAYKTTEKPIQGKGKHRRRQKPRATQDGNTAAGKLLRRFLVTMATSAAVHGHQKSHVSDTSVIYMEGGPRAL